MERFHYTIKQKLQLLLLVGAGQIFRIAEQFPRVTQKQAEDWKENAITLLCRYQTTVLLIHTGLTFNL